MKSYYDIAGDGGSDVLEQVQAQDASVARNLADVRNLVAIGSGKGGVGKSTVTMQLACALRELGNRVSILDADLNGPCQARLGGLRDQIFIPGKGGARMPRTQNGIGVVSMGSLVPEPRAVEFETVSAGASHTWRATKEFTILREFLACMDWGKLDYLLVDLPPGVERIVQYAELLGPKALFVLIGIPSDVSRGVVARSIDVLKRLPNRVLGYVENMSGYYCPECQKVKPLFAEHPQVKLDVSLLGTLPFDPELAALCDRGGSLEGSPGLSCWEPMQRIVEEMCQRVAESAADRDPESLKEENRA